MNHHSPSRIYARGLSLIELLVALAVVAIVASVAYPTYGNYVKRASRTQAQAALLEASLYLQYFYARNDRFDASAMTGTPIELPQRLLQSPSDSSVTSARYRIGLAEVYRNSYVLEAVPVGLMKGDDCGTFRLTHTGERMLLSDARLSMAECWR